MNRQVAVYLCKVIPGLLIVLVALAYIFTADIGSREKSIDIIHQDSLGGSSIARQFRLQHSEESIPVRRKLVESSPLSLRSNAVSRSESGTVMLLFPESTHKYRSNTIVIESVERPGWTLKPEINQPLDILEGDYRVDATAPFRLSKSCSFHVVAGNHVTVNVPLLAPQRELWCQLLGPEGSPLPNFEVVGPGFMSSKSNDNGMIMFLDYNYTSNNEEFSIKLLDPSFSADPSILEWESQNQRIIITHQKGTPIIVNSSESIDSCMVFGLHEYRPHAAFRSWHPLLIPGDKRNEPYRLAAILNSINGVVGPYPLDVFDQEKGALINMQAFTSVNLSADTTWSDSATIGFAYDPTDRLGIMDPIIRNYSELEGYDYGSWVYSKEQTLQSFLRNPTVQSGVSTLVIIVDRGGTIRYGPFVVNEKSRNINLFGGTFIADKRVSVQFTLPNDYEEDIRAFLVINGKPASPPTEVSDRQNRVNFSSASSGNARIVIESKEREKRPALWSPMYSHDFDLAKYDGSNISIDLTHLVSVRITGEVITAQKNRNNLKKVLFMAKNPKYRSPIVGNPRRFGSFDEITGKNVADINVRGLFDCLVGPGRYRLDLADESGRDIGIASLFVDTHESHNVVLNAQPRTVVIDGIGSFLTVVGPTGPVVVDLLDHGAAKFSYAISGHYRASWMDDSGAAVVKKFFVLREHSNTVVQ